MTLGYLGTLYKVLYIMATVLKSQQIGSYNLMGYPVQQSNRPGRLASFFLFWLLTSYSSKMVKYI